MSDDPRRLGEPDARGAHILDPSADRPARVRRRQSLQRLIRRPWVWAVAAVTVLSTVVTLLNTSLDLFDRLDRDRDRVPLQGEVNTAGPPGDPDSLIQWSESQALCEDMLADPLTRQPTEQDARRADDDLLGTGATSAPTATTNSWALADTYEVPESRFDRDEFLAAGAIQLGTRDVEVILFNRRDHDVVVTNLTATIQRRPPYGGTLMRERGGDPVAIRLLLLDLAEDEPVAMTLDDLCQPYPFFARYKLAVEPGRAEVLAIRTFAAPCYCRYRLKIDYWYEGTHHIATVPAADRPPLESMGESPTGYDLVYDVGGSPGTTKHDCRLDRASCAGASSPDSTGEPSGG